MNTLEFAKSLRDSLCIGSTIIAAISIAWLVSTLLRNYEIRNELKKLKKWRKFSEIEKKQKHEKYDQLATELAEELAFNETQGDMHVRLMLKYASENEVNVKIRSEVEELSAERYRLACENSELKKEIKIAQTCLKVAETEITELKAKLERKRNEKGQFVKKYDSEVRTDQERDWTTATKEELLAEAKRRYPVGTKFLSIDYEIGETLEIVRPITSGDSDCIYTLTKAPNDSNPYRSVYELGKWAKIIPNA